MEKTNINRLLHVFVPFIIMVMSQNLLLLLWDRIGFTGILGELIAFIIASAVATAFFSLMPQGLSDGAFPIRRTDMTSAVMHLFFCMAMLILAMHLVSLITSNYTSSPVRLSPLYVISLIIIHPIVEEYIFRGLFYGELRRINPVFGIIAQAIMFAIIHNTVDGMTYALAAGIFLGVTAEKTGRLWVPILAHMLINGRSLFYIVLFNENELLRQSIDIGAVSLGFLSFFILLLMKSLRNDRRREDNEDKTEEISEWTEVK